MAESKGRTNGCEPSALEKAKEQSRKLADCIGGKDPRLRLGAVTYFKRDDLAFVAVDPSRSNSDNARSNSSGTPVGFAGQIAQDSLTYGG